jgi:hypothetical protein
MSNSTKLPVPHRIAVVKATRAESDEQLLSRGSSHSARRVRGGTSRRTACSHRAADGTANATVEDVRTALENVTHGVGKVTRHHVLRRNPDRERPGSLDQCLPRSPG